MNPIFLIVGPDHAPFSPQNQALSFIEWYIFYPLILLFIIVFIVTFIFIKKEVINHWNVFIPHFSYSSKSFYQQLTESLLSHGVDDISYTTKNIATANMIGQRRIYLRVTWKGYTYDVCAAPFGDGYFFSYWGQREPHKLKFALSKIPWIGFWLSEMIFPVTYYSIDNDTMFHTLFHECTLDLVNTITKEKNLPPLAPEQTQPNIKDLFAR